MKTPDSYTVWTILAFAINYSRLKCAQLFEDIFIILSEPQCFVTSKLWIKQHLSLVNPTIVTKLQLLIRMRQLVYTADEELRNDDAV